ncbi:hypothetical protein [Pyrobaculum islandicum]|nr:hypothetical protein [Pyrobaculum islandicum]
MTYCVYGISPYMYSSETHIKEAAQLYKPTNFALIDIFIGSLQLKAFST